MDEFPSGIGLNLLLGQPPPPKCKEPGIECRMHFMSMTLPHMRVFLFPHFIRLEIVLLSVLRSSPRRLLLIIVRTETHCGVGVCHLSRRMVWSKMSRFLPKQSSRPWDLFFCRPIAAGRGDWPGTITEGRFLQQNVG